MENFDDIKLEESGDNDMNDIGTEIALILFIVLYSFLGILIVIFLIKCYIEKR